MFEIDTGYEPFNPQTVEELEKMAEEFGCILIQPAENQLTLDLDSEEDVEKLNDRLALCPYSVSLVETWRSKSGNTHALLKLYNYRRFSTLEKIQMQALLGSDRERELINITRYLRGDDENTLRVLFQPKKVSPRKPPVRYAKENTAI